MHKTSSRHSLWLSLISYLSLTFPMWQAPEPSTTTAQTHRKLPDVPRPVLRQSKSSENILDDGRAQSMYCDAELSLPAHLIPRPKTRGRKTGANNAKVKKLVVIPSTLSEAHHHQSVSGPEVLSHYNRVSLKRRKERNSYEKAVTASQIKYTAATNQSKVGGNLCVALAEATLVYVCVSGWS